MILLSHPTGNANVRNTMRAFHEADMLAAFVTFLSTGNSPLISRLANTGVFKDLERRRFDKQYTNLIQTCTWPELLRVIARRSGIIPLIRSETGFVSQERNNSRLGYLAARQVLSYKRKSKIKAVYCYEDAALETFEAAKSVGIRTIYEMPTGYWRAKSRLLQEEAELQPAWASLLGGIRDSNAKCSRKDEELEMADLIVTASGFSSDTLGYSTADVSQLLELPYGAPQVTEKSVSPSRKDKLKVLFVGNLSQQKGISYMFEALKNVSSFVDTTVIGGMAKKDCTHLNRALENTQYIPSLPHNEVLNHMRQNDVLVFPTLFDGFGLVLLEAMSQGMTVIATPNCGAPDVIENDYEGFIVPIRDPQAIAEKLELLHLDRERLDAMKEAARAKASRFTWRNYRNKLATAISEFLKINANG